MPADGGNIDTIKAAALTTLFAAVPNCTVLHQALRVPCWNKDVAPL